MVDRLWSTKVWTSVDEAQVTTTWCQICAANLVDGAPTRGHRGAGQICARVTPSSYFFRGVSVQMASSSHAVLLGDDSDAQGLVLALLSPRDLASLRGTCRAAAVTAAPPGIRRWADLCHGDPYALAAAGAVRELQYLSSHGAVHVDIGLFMEHAAACGQLGAMRWLLEQLPAPPPSILSSVWDKALLRALVPTVGRVCDQLYAAALEGNVAYVELLLELGGQGRQALVNALVAACGRAHAGCGEVLLAAGADTEATSTWGGSTPLMAACAAGDAACTRLLLRHGARVNGRGGGGRTALMTAAGVGSQCVAELLAAGSDVQAADWSGRTALMMADGVNLGMLIIAGADLDAADREGQTALMRACQAGAVDRTRQLLQAGAGLGLLDNENRCALQLATANEQWACVELMARSHQGLELPPPPGHGGMPKREPVPDAPSTFCDDGGAP